MSVEKITDSISQLEIKEENYVTIQKIIEDI